MNTRSNDVGEVSERLAGVRRRVAVAAERAGRDPAGVTIVGVGKLQPIAAIHAAVAAGLLDIGENYAQELEHKAAALPGVRWHFVGRLQRNKAAKVVAVDALVHSLDSLALAEALARHAVAAGTTARALVQVEPQRRAAAHGVAPEALGDFVAACRELEGLRLEGLMVLPPPGSLDDARAAFREVAELARNLPSGMRDLSMGMTADFEVAVGEGATIVRIGTAIFGERPKGVRGPQG